MDETKRITAEQLKVVVDKKGFPEPLLAKDYFLTVLLYLMKDIPGLYFKGGTALNKIFLNYARLSEDIDFTLTRNVKTVRKEIEKVITESKLFEGITDDKRVDKFVRLIVHYTDPSGSKGTVFIDLNRKGKLLLSAEKHTIPHFYEENIPEFSFPTLAKKEMLAEKMAATIGRNKPRDHFDLYQIVRKKLPLDLSLVKKKCESSECEFDIIKMFNRAKKLKNRWDEDMGPLLAEEISFQKVMKFLAEHFKLKKEKQKKTSNS